MTRSDWLFLALAVLQSFNTWLLRIVQKQTNGKEVR